MKTWKAIVAALLLSTFLAASCATISPPVFEEEEEIVDPVYERWNENREGD